ncbi:hypothetical protein MAR_029748 [Mya arenaria]|uniref:DUF6570 domain-containing protein n=1 Tax=Mya arenaria TaxID=6604 RepID=A0ABY7DJG9_MYAAR|nr:hypothetical protein MAR_029748 [Mya arenaria]
MAYNFLTCNICHETRLSLGLHTDSVCKRCKADKHEIKMFSHENKMNPEQQLIARISPCMNIFMLKHGGVASSGHSVTIPQEINEPAKVFPRLPHEIDIIKDFKVSRSKVESSLRWLKTYNPAYNDIVILKERLNLLPENGELSNIAEAEVSSEFNVNDNGPAPEQLNVEIDDDCFTATGVILPDNATIFHEKIKNIVKKAVGDSQAYKVETNKKSSITIPWPTR